MRLTPSKPWIKSNTLPFDDAAPIFFEASAWLGPVRVKNGQYMNLQRLDSSIQGSLDEAERLTTFFQPRPCWAKPCPPDIIITSQNRPDLPGFRAE